MAKVIAIILALTSSPDFYPPSLGKVKIVAQYPQIA